MLKRDISTTNILIASAGGMIGSGWLFSPFISAQMAGSNALISWIIAAFFMVIIALPLCELGAMLPISGGLSNYPTFTHGKEVGFLFAWTSWLSYVVMTPIEIQAILQYSSYFFPFLVSQNSAAFHLSGYGYAAAILIMSAVVMINSYGIKMLVECNKYASIVKFILPITAIVCLIYTAPNFSNVQLTLNDKKSWENIFTALSAGGVAFAFTGFQNGLVLAGEVKNPQRNIPLSILGSVLIGFCLYFMLQLSFIIALPAEYISQGWHNIDYPGVAAPLVGLALLVGLSLVATLLLFDAALSPFGSTLVYTAATSRILYGMALNDHLPKLFLKLNRHKVPYITLYANLFVGALSFLPFPGWQKLVAFLSSASILSYSIGPICFLAFRKLKPDSMRPFQLAFGYFCAYLAFYFCNLMLYWCGFSILWKLNVALLIGLCIYASYHRKNPFTGSPMVYWFFLYIGSLLVISYYGSFGGIGLLHFPIDCVIVLPFSIFILTVSQKMLSFANHDFKEIEAREDIAF